MGPLAAPAATGDASAAHARSHRPPLLTPLRGRYVPAIFRVRVAPARDEPRIGLNNSERESTSGRSIRYASGHLIPVFRYIGRMFSLFFLLSHPCPLVTRTEGGFKSERRNMVSSEQKTVSIVFLVELTAPVWTGIRGARKTTLWHEDEAIPLTFALRAGGHHRLLGMVRICSNRYEGQRSLMQPRIAFASLMFLPPWPVLSLVLPASSFARAPWLARRAPEIGA